MLERRSRCSVILLCLQRNILWENAARDRCLECPRILKISLEVVLYFLKIVSPTNCIPHSYGFDRDARSRKAKLKRISKCSEELEVSLEPSLALERKQMWQHAFCWASLLVEYAISNGNDDYLGSPIP